MKLLAKPSLPVLKVILIVALVGLPAWFQFRSTEPPKVALAIIQRVTRVGAPGILGRMQALETLRAHSSTIATGDTSGIIFSGAALPGSILTRYLAAAGYIRCLHVCSLTAKGRAQHWAVKPLLGPLTQITVPLADLTVNEVTGIHSGIVGIATGQTIVDLSYRVKPNALGRAMLTWSGSRRFCGVDYAARWKGAQPGQATFTKYEGTWRFAGGASAAGGLNPFGAACAMP